MLAGIKFLFGRENITAVAVIYALYGAVIVAAGHAIADRAIGDRVAWAGPVVGLFLLVYYPLIAVGGYVLSEAPFSFCLTLSVLLLLRIVDEGSKRLAWLLGLLLGIGMLIRPQLLMHVALIGAVWLLMRFRSGNPYGKLGWGHIVRIGVPIVLLLTMASIRLHVHTGRYGLVSENSDINLVFGRCHNKGIYSRRDDQGHGTVRFSPPPLIQLEAHSEKNPTRGSSRSRCGVIIPSRSSPCRASRSTSSAARDVRVASRAARSSTAATSATERSTKSSCASASSEVGSRARLTSR